MHKPSSHFLASGFAVVLLSLGVSISAQQNRQHPAQPTQMEQQDTSLYPGDNPTDRPVAAATGMANSQSFTGTIVRSGDRFVLQAAHGNIYDLDNQEAVRPFEGKRVSLHGTLEPKTKLIHLEQQ